jgi:hypothetical protein
MPAPLIAGQHYYSLGETFFATECMTRNAIEERKRLSGNNDIDTVRLEVKSQLRMDSCQGCWFSRRLISCDLVCCNSQRRPDGQRVFFDLVPTKSSAQRLSELIAETRLAQN